MEPIPTPTAPTVETPEPSVNYVPTSSQTMPSTTVIVTPEAPAPKPGNAIQRFVHDPVVVRFVKGALMTALSAVLLYTIKVLPSLNLLSGTDLSIVVGVLLALEKQLQLPQ